MLPSAHTHYRWRHKHGLELGHGTADCGELFMPYNNNMTNRSVRQIVKVSVGGDVIRLKLRQYLLDASP